jgi:hypothetical protein
VWDGARADSGKSFPEAELCVRGQNTCTQLRWRLPNRVVIASCD